VPSFPPRHDDLAARGLTVTLSAPRSGAVLLRCAGEIDVCTGPMFGRALDTACGPVARVSGPGVTETGLVVLDLAGITFFSVRGVSVLLTAEETAASRGRRIRVVAPSPAVRRVLRVTGTAARFSATVDVVGEPG
jgi:anti-anti-sigma factor